MRHSTTRRRFLRFGIQASLLIGSSACRPRPSPRRVRWPRRVHWWVADRAAQCVVGLDDRLVPVCSTPAANPRSVVACPDGGAWVVERPDRLTRLGPNGARRATRELGRLLQLAPRPGVPGEALCLERTASADRLLAVGSGAAVRELCAPGRVRAFAVAGRYVLFDLEGSASLVVYDLEEPPAPVARLTGGPTAVVSLAGCSPSAPRPEREWWSLSGEDTRTLVRWSRGLHPRWSRTLEFSGEHLLVDAQRDGVWVAGGRTLTLRFFDVEARAGCRHVLGRAGPVRALAATASGPLLALPGAVLALDRDGGVRAFQGGFRGISALSGIAPDAS